jgi:hypothetical protein
LSAEPVAFIRKTGKPLPFVGINTIGNRTGAPRHQGKQRLDSAKTPDPGLSVRNL